MSKKSRVDPRIIRTRKLLKDAMFSIVSEKGFLDITIQDLTERATLSRATFYLHYRDKSEVLTDLLGDLLTEANLIPPTLSDPDQQITIPTLPDLFRHVARYSTFYHMLSSKGSSSMGTLWAYVDEVTERWAEFLFQSGVALDVEEEMYGSFLSGAFLGVLTWWLDNEMPHTPEVMAAKLVNMITKGFPTQYFKS